MSQNIGAAKIFIIIPVLNEAGNIKEAIPTVGYANATTQPSKDIEVIIIDSGSEDGTVEIAQSLSVKVISSSPGRAVQMNQEVSSN